MWPSWRSEVHARNSCVFCAERCDKRLRQRSRCFDRKIPPGSLDLGGLVYGKQLLVEHGCLLHGYKLTLVQVCVHSLGRDEFVMRTYFDNLAVVQHDDSGRIADRR